MRLANLIDTLGELLKVHGDIHVILQSDQEGNYYNDASGAEFTFYLDDSTGDSRDEVGEDAQEVIVIYP